MTFAAPVDAAGDYTLARHSESGGDFYLELLAGRQVRTCSGDTKGCNTGSW